MGKTKILIVEDEVIVAEDIKRSLENMGYEVTSILKTGEAAFNIKFKRTAYKLRI